MSVKNLVYCIGEYSTHKYPKDCITHWPKLPLSTSVAKIATTNTITAQAAITHTLPAKAAMMDVMPSNRPAQTRASILAVLCIFISSPLG
jgi:hypothetical protein